MQNDNNSFNFEEEKDSLLSIGDASDSLGVSVDTLRRWEKRGKIDAYRSPGGHRYFKRQDLQELFGTKYERLDEEEDEEEKEKDKDESRETKQDQTIEAPAAKAAPEPEEKKTAAAAQPTPPVPEEAQIEAARGKEKRDVNIPDLTPVSVPRPQTPLESSETDERGTAMETGLSSEQHAKITEILSYKPSGGIAEETAKEKGKGFNWTIVIAIVLILLLAADAYLFYVWFTSNNLVSPLP